MTELTITLPKKLNFYSFDTILEKINDIKSGEYEKVVFDLTKINFVEPRGVTLLTNIISWLKRQKIRLTIRYFTIEENTGRNLDAMLYLRDIGFFEINGFRDFYGKQSLRDTMLSINKIETKSLNHWNDLEFLEYMRAQTYRRTEFSHLRVAVEEIFNNIADHSTENIGCVSAQYYPKNNEICISFSDFGIGIPSSLRNNQELIESNHSDISDLEKLKDSELLEFAVKEGVSTQAKPGNRGAGLNNIIRSLTNDNIGTLYIRSNFGEIWFENKKVKTKRESQHYYPGTFYDIILRTDNEKLFDADLEEEFGWLD